MPDSFATPQDYENRYGEYDDTEQLQTLLADASALIQSQPGFTLLDSTAEGYALQQANLVRITCSMVYRSISAGDLAGLASYSQGGVGYTASVSPYNPSGDMYLTKSEKQALGIFGGRVGTVYATIHDGCGGVVWPSDSPICPSY